LPTIVKLATMSASSGSWAWHEAFSFTVL